MAWPPPALPVNRTDIDPLEVTHAADHNAVNLAINDLVTKVKSLLSGHTNMGLPIWLKAGGLYDATKQMRQLTYRASHTSNQFGQIYIAPVPAFTTFISHASVAIISSGAGVGGAGYTAQIDATNLPSGSNITFLLYNPAGNLMVNALVDLQVLIIGQ